MIDRDRQENDALASARDIVRGMALDLRRGSVMPDGGPSWRHLRGQALRYFVILPIIGAARAGIRALRRIRLPRRGHGRAQAIRGDARR